MNKLITELLEGVQNDTLTRSQIIEKLETLQDLGADLDSATNVLMDLIN